MINTRPPLTIVSVSATCEVGGSDINILRLYQQLFLRGYNLVHVVPFLGPIASEFEKVGVCIEVVSMPRIRKFVNPLEYIKVICGFFPAVFKLIRVIRKHNPDIVCTTSMVMPYAACAAFLTRKTHILIAGEYLPVLRIAAVYFQLLSKRIICCSKLVAGQFFSSKKVVVNYHGIDLNDFMSRAPSERVQAALGSAYPCVVMISRLVPWKGADVFLAASSYLKEQQVTFVLYGQTVDGYEQYASDLQEAVDKEDKNRVVFLRDSDIAVCDILDIADIVVHASLKPEPFGLVVIEAMAKSKAVIASNLGGPSEIIEQEVDGQLIAPGNPEILARQVKRLLDDQDLRKQLGINARLTAVKRFDIREYARRFDELFKGLVIVEKPAAYSLKQRFLHGLAHACTLFASNKKKDSATNDEISNIVVIQLFGLGDMLCSFPALKMLRTHFKTQKIIIICRQEISQICGLLGDGFEIKPVGLGVVSVFLIIRWLRKQAIDCTIVFNPLLLGALIAHLGKSRRVISYVHDRERFQDISRFESLITQSVVPPQERSHDVAYYKNIASAVGASGLPYEKNDFVLSSEHMKWADDFLKQNNINEHACIIGINPHARWNSRCWNLSRFADVCQHLSDRYDARIVIIGSDAKEDLKRVELLIAQTKVPLISACGKCSLLELAALMLKFRLFISNDSGPMHLASFLDIPSVAIFGPGDRHKFGYTKNNVKNVYASNVFCSPCFLNYYYAQECKRAICLEHVSVSDVISAVESLMCAT